MEVIVAALVVVGLLVIAGRFFLSESGEIRLPAILDESIGMWAMRRITRRRLWQRDEPTDDEIPGTNGVPPAAAATPGRPVAPASTAIAWPAPDRDGRYDAARRSAAIAAASGTIAHSSADTTTAIGTRRRSRLAALLAVMAIAMIAVAVVGLTVLPHASPGPGGNSLDGSGGLGGSAAAVAPGGSATASGAAARSSSPAGSAAPSGAARSSTGPASGSAAPPSGSPAPTPTPAPTTTPAPTPAPTPTPAPLKAALSCSAVVLLATCNGSASTGAATYQFDFGDGTPAVRGPSPLALHAYPAAGTYTVTLTVTDGQGHSATDTTSLKVGP